MCIGGLANPGDPLGLQGLNKTRQAANSMFGWGDKEARGVQPSPTVNVYPNQPSGDVTKNSDDLKVGTQGGQKGGQTTWKTGG